MVVIMVMVMIIVMTVVIVDHGYGEGGGGGADDDDDDGSEHDDEDEIPNDDANDVSTCTRGLWLLFSAPALGRVQRPLLLHVHERQRGAPPVCTLGLHPPPQPTLRGAKRLPHPLCHPA